MTPHRRLWATALGTVPAALIALILATTLTAEPAAATILGNAQAIDIGRSYQDAPPHDADNPPSTTRRIVIGGAGLLLGLTLAIQQARSRLQTKDPDTL